MSETLVSPKKLIETWNILGNNNMRVELLSYVSSEKLFENQKKYTLYIMRVIQNQRSWCVYRRYSEFFTLSKTLKDLKYQIPNLPPKVEISQLWQNTPEKRKGGLQSFIDGITVQKEILHEECVKSFFKLYTMEQNTFYCLPDAAIRRIFRFLSLNEMFNKVSLVSMWWRTTLYQSFLNIDISVIKKSVYFGNNLIRLDSMYDFANLLKHFKLAKVIKLNHIEMLNDETWDDISKESFRLRTISLIQSGLVHPKFYSHKITHLNLQNSKLLTGIKLTNGSEDTLTFLNLSGTSVCDLNLKILEKLKNLETLSLSDCENLRIPHILGDKIKTLDLSFCSSLTKPKIELPSCTILDLRHTPIVDETLDEMILPLIEILYLSGCDNLCRPKIHLEALQDLYMQWCTGVNSSSLEILRDEKGKAMISCPNLKFVDLRRTKMDFEQENVKIIK